MSALTLSTMVASSTPRQAAIVHGGPNKAAASWSWNLVVKTCVQGLAAGLSRCRCRLRSPWCMSCLYKLIVTVMAKDKILYLYLM